MADGESNMALLEIAMISGYVPDRTSLHSLLEDPATSECPTDENTYIHIRSVRIITHCDV